MTGWRRRRQSRRGGAGRPGRGGRRRGGRGRAAIRRTFRFHDFAAAFGFMAHIAVLAEKQDHHPEWFNVYNRVDVVLTTHDAGGVTDRDLTLARAMDRAAHGVTSAS